MSSEIDPAKLKVVELRAELCARGLDSKGNKAVLVKRLKDALEKELKKELPDTSIIDTSTEDLNISQTDEPVTIETQKKDEQKDIPPADVKKQDKKSPEKDDKIETVSVKEDDKTKSEEVVKKELKQQKELEEPGEKKTKILNLSESKVVTDTENEKMVDVSEKVKEKSNIEEVKLNEKCEKADSIDQQLLNKQSNEDQQKQEENESKTESLDTSCLKGVEEPMETGNDSELPEKKEETVTNASVQRGDKRKRSPSPSRAQRRRSKSPVKEDEPVIDNSKVQLNWYDSDLHLQIDKESFLSGKPYHDGAFGYIWSGARATHGANSGKVCYEVKITEELKWEDIIRQPDKGWRERERKDSRRERSDRKDKSSDRRKIGDKSADKKDSKNRGKGEHREEKVNDKEELSNVEASKEEDPTPTSKEDDSVEKGVKDEVKEETVTQESTGEDSKKEEDSKMEVCEHKESTESMEVDEKDEEKTDDKNDKKTDEKDEKKTDDKNDKKEESDKEDKKDNTEQTGENKEKEISRIPTHLIRIGWSSLSSGLQLGESKFSYGFESSGKFASNKEFFEYGKPFAVGDVIGAYLEFTEKEINIRYTLNGEELPLAISIPKSEVPEENFSLFPHVLSRNFAFEVNLGGKEEPFFKHPETLSDYIYIDKFENKILGPTRPETRGECEVIMMCGLPGSGKTHWVKEHVANNPDKRYTVIGNTQLLEKMTVNGNPLKNSLKGRWNVVLDKLSKCLNKLVEVAALRRRNYVIDQTNVFPSAQRRKMRPFEGFKRRAVIVVCGDEEQDRRRTLQEAQDGKDVPNIAVYEMKANMSLPKVGDWLEEVSYVELDEQQAKAMVQKYNKEGKDNGFGHFTQRREYRDDRARWQPNRRNDYRGAYRERNYPPSRFDRGSKHGSWQGRPGSWNRNDRRDSRGSSSRSRDWRNNNRGTGQRYQDRGRDRNSRHSRESYSRSRNQGSSRSQGGSWQGSSGSGSWGSGSYGTSQGNWQGQGSGSNWNQNYGSGGQGKWNYGGQGGYGQQQGYNYPNWSYLGEYQNFIGQNPQQTGVNNGSSSGSTGWSQYPQQYTQNLGNQSTARK